jgi:hypothetical protein
LIIFTIELTMQFIFSWLHPLPQWNAVVWFANDCYFMGGIIVTCRCTQILTYPSCFSTWYEV